MQKITCRWCQKEFQRTVSTVTKNGETVRNVVVCPYCCRILPSSIKEILDPITGRHIHKEWPKA